MLEEEYKDKLSVEARQLIDVSCIIRRVCHYDLDDMPHGKAREIIRKLTGVADYLDAKANAMPKVEQ